MECTGTVHLAFSSTWVVLVQSAIEVYLHWHIQFPSESFRTSPSGGGCQCQWSSSGAEQKRQGQDVLYSYALRYSSVTMNPRIFEFVGLAGLDHILSWTRSVEPDEAGRRRRSGRRQIRTRSIDFSLLEIIPQSSCFALSSSPPLFLLLFLSSSSSFVVILFSSVSLLRFRVE